MTVSRRSQRCDAPILRRYSGAPLVTRMIYFYFAVVLPVLRVLRTRSRVQVIGEMNTAKAAVMLLFFSFDCSSKLEAPNQRCAEQLMT